jgi:peptide/nickel transport system ATP-binding protein
MSQAASQSVVDIQGLTVRLPRGSDRAHAIDTITFSVGPGEIVCVVGESGSGKSVTAQAVMGLLPGELSATAGRIVLQGENVLEATPARLRDLRGTRMAMIFQEPMTALNPVMRVGEQIAEVLEIHTDLSEADRRQRVLQIMRQVHLPEPERLIDVYPHQLSGGQRQRIMIAAALVLDPALLIADEPTTALDVTTQAQILALLKDLQREFGSAVILITHDLGVVAETVDDVIVMYAARIAERGPVEAIFSQPRHPYTWGLMASLPRLDTTVERLDQIPGQPPSLLRPPSGCRFHPRCRYAMPKCLEREPRLEALAYDPRHEQACHLDEATKAREAAALLAAVSAEAVS